MEYVELKSADRMHAIALIKRNVIEWPEYQKIYGNIANSIKAAANNGEFNTRGILYKKSDFAHKSNDWVNELINALNTNIKKLGYRFDIEYHDLGKEWHYRCEW